MHLKHIKIQWHEKKAKCATSLMDTLSNHSKGMTDGNRLTNAPHIMPMCPRRSFILSGTVP